MESPLTASTDKTSDRDGLFASTRWSIVLQAGDSGAPSSQSHSALSELCRIYWRPIYLFLRRQGHGIDDAQDLAQGFFADLITTRSYARADREKGRFRSFLLGALKHFVVDVRDRDRATKRGGGIPLEPLDERAISEAEAQLGRNGKWSADEAYDREWAAALLRRALNRVAEECAIAGKGDLFSYLKPYLSTAADEAVPYEEMSRRMQRPVTTLRSDVARLRARYRTVLRQEVQGTVADQSDVDEELRYLYRSLGGK